MTSVSLDRLVAPGSVAIVGLSAEPAKHGARVLSNLRKLGYPGRVDGVNPRLPDIDGVDVYRRLDELPTPPDLVVCAVPAEAVPGVVAGAARSGAGAVVVFAGGFAESGRAGLDLQMRLGAEATNGGVRVLGPNSGGVIRPATGLAASFLTCLDRPAHQIRSGPVGIVTQSGGTGSYLHNLAAEHAGGLAVSISTGNEVDIGVAEAIEVCVDLDEVHVIGVVLETVRRGSAFVDALASARIRGKPVVVCRLGSSRRGERLMSSHTGAMAVPGQVLDGVLDDLGVVVADTPGELLEVAEVLARSGPVSGPRVGVVTHSGGVAILLADLADRNRVDLPSPGPDLRGSLGSLLQHGSTGNPLDMGGIIGGAGRFAEVVGLVAGSGDVDAVLAVSTAHPPAHTTERVDGLLSLPDTVPIVHLWMAGDLGRSGLDRLRAAGRPVCVEPRAAVRALAGLIRVWEAEILEGSGEVPDVAPGPVPGDEQAAKELLESWGLPVVEGGFATVPDDSARIAEELDGPVAMKVIAPGLVHKTEVGGVRLGIAGPDAAREAHRALASAVSATGVEVVGVRVERMCHGVEVVVGLVRDSVFGPMTMLGWGGVAVEARGSQAFTQAPVSSVRARRMVTRVAGLTDGLERAAGGRDPVGELITLVETCSRRFVELDLDEWEMNPVVWNGSGWHVVDVMMARRGG